VYHIYLHLKVIDPTFHTFFQFRLRTCTSTLASIETSTSIVASIIASTVVITGAITGPSLVPALGPLGLTQTSPAITTSPAAPGQHWEQHLSKHWARDWER
jgi:hypothetical protein